MCAGFFREVPLSSDEHGGIVAHERHQRGRAIADAYNAWDSTRKKNVFFKGPDLDIAHTLNQILLLTKGYDQIAKETKSDDVVVTTNERSHHDVVAHRVGWSIVQASKTYDLMEKIIDKAQGRKA